MLSVTTTATPSVPRPTGLDHSGGTQMGRATMIEPSAAFTATNALAVNLQTIGTSSPATIPTARISSGSEVDHSVDTSSEEGSERWRVRETGSDDDLSLREAFSSGQSLNRWTPPLEDEGKDEEYIFYLKKGGGR